MTVAVAAALIQPGMVTDATWADLNCDGRQDTLLCGEWMPIRVFLNERGRLVARSADYFDQAWSGQWNRLLAADFDGDGDIDLVAGSLGRNSQMKASAQEPAMLVYRDFDTNGSVDPILCFYVQGKSCPFLTRDELLDQMVSMRPRFTTYERFATAGLSDLFTPAELSGADTLTINHFETTYFENANGRFKIKPLPPEAQFAPVYALATIDNAGTGKKDLILAGNQSASRLRFGQYDANYGQVFSLDENGRWQVKNAALGWTGDVRSVLEIKVKGHSFYITGTNNEALRVFNLEDK